MHDDDHDRDPKPAPDTSKRTDHEQPETGIEAPAVPEHELETNRRREIASMGGRASAESRRAAAARRPELDRLTRQAEALAPGLALEARRQVAPAALELLTAAALELRQLAGDAPVGVALLQLHRAVAYSLAADAAVRCGDTRAATLGELSRSAMCLAYDLARQSRAQREAPPQPLGPVIYTPPEAAEQAVPVTVAAPDPVPERESAPEPKPPELTNEERNARDSEALWNAVCARRLLKETGIITRFLPEREREAALARRFREEFEFEVASEMRRLDEQKRYAK